MFSSQPILRFLEAINAVLPATLLCALPNLLESRISLKSWWCKCYVAANVAFATVAEEAFSASSQFRTVCHVSRSLSRQWRDLEVNIILISAMRMDGGFGSKNAGKPFRRDGEKDEDKSKNELEHDLYGHHWLVTRCGARCSNNPDHGCR